MATKNKTKRKSVYIRFLNEMRAKLQCTAMQVPGTVMAVFSSNLSMKAEIEKLKEEIAKLKEELKAKDAKLKADEMLFNELHAEIKTKDDELFSLKNPN